MAEISPSLVAVGIAPIQTGKRGECFEAGGQLMVTRRAGKSFGIHLFNAFCGGGPVFDQPLRPDAALLIQKRVVHQDQ